jgi:hypothetical protein
MLWQTVFMTFEPSQAQLVRSRLEAAGFTANVTNELAAQGMDMAVGGIKVQVPSESADEARALLEAPAQSS